MKTGLFVFTPQWIMFDQFWISLKMRNRWLIILRYGAVLMLVGLMSTVQLLPHITIETLPIAFITGCILAYNVILHYSMRFVPSSYARFHGLHFALIQISADLIALLFIIYFTGGAEAPFSPMFLFHVIIASLILPAGIVSLIILTALVAMITGAVLEFHSIIPHYAISGLFAEPLYKNQTYLFIHFTVFTLTMFISNYLANSISKELYLRERSLTHAYKKLEEAEEAKSKYVMSIVHDLKTPIAAAMTYLNMILDRTFGPIKEEMKRPLERSRLRLHNAITVINDILQLTQVKLTSNIEVSDINLTKLIEEIYQEMRILFISKQIRFSTWTNALQDIHIQAEPKLLKLALANLLSNTYKYTEEGGRVEVHLKTIDSSLIIEVADNGIGIPAEEQNKIFEDFYRTSISKKKSTEGTGLGLSVVQHIIKQLNGTIRVESPSRLNISEDRPGTAFIITLPKVYSIPRNEHEREAV